ncbi:hypothetical protein TNCT_562891, partial [Trichonephila clavata]
SVCKFASKLSALTKHQNRFGITFGMGREHLTLKEIEEILNQIDCISDDSSEGNSEDVVLPDEIEVFVENEEGIIPSYRGIIPNIIMK